MSAADEVIKPVDSSMTSPEPGLRRQVMSYSQSLMLVRHKMEPGWIGAAHSHPHDQVVYVVSGHLRVVSAGRTFDVKSGDSFVVRGGVEHQASAMEPSLVIDVFTPCREDYI